MDPRLWISASGDAPHSYALSGERTVVGRSPEADVVLEDEAVSWNHLEIERRGDVLMATDLDSRNGTALNGEPLDRPRRLRDGDTLIVGGYRLEVKTGAVTPVHVYFVLPVLYFQCFDSSHHQASGPFPDVLS